MSNSTPNQCLYKDIVLFYLSRRHDNNKNEFFFKKMTIYYASVVNNKKLAVIQKNEYRSFFFVTLSANSGMRLSFSFFFSRYSSPSSSIPSVVLYV